MKKIKLWFLKTFFPKAYYRYVWKKSLKQISDSCKTATICMEELAKALKEYGDSQ